MSQARAFLRHWQNWLSLILVLLFIFVAIAAPHLSPNDPQEPGPFKVVGRIVESRPLPPDDNAVLGMLPRGIDVYHALIWGTRDALLFGLIVTIASALFGIIYGAFSGYLGGRIGAWMLRISDSFLAFPPIAGLVFLQQLHISTITLLGGYLYDGVIYNFRDNDPIGPTVIQYLIENVNPLMLSLIVFSWMPYARLVHSIVITLKQTDFIQAARALGGSTPWIIRKHLLRNSMGPSMVLAARDVGGVVLLQATLTFIGLGGESVWGTMLADGRNWVLGPGGNLMTYWWVFLPPTLAVMLFGIAWNMFGDGLAETLSPAAYVAGGTSFWSRFRKTSNSTEEAEEELAPVALQKGTLPAWQEALQANPAEKPFPTPTINPILVAARANVKQGELSKALHAYDYLIRRGRVVEQLLPDLAQLVKQYPRHPQVWQTLGDALAQAGDLEHANQSYAQARKYAQ